MRHAVEDGALFGLEPRGVGVERCIKGLDACPKRRFATPKRIGECDLSGGWSSGGAMLIHGRKVRVQGQMCKHRLPTRECAASMAMNVKWEWLWRT